MTQVSSSQVSKFVSLVRTQSTITQFDGYKELYWKGRDIKALQPVKNFIKENGNKDYSGVGNTHHLWFNGLLNGYQTDLAVYSDKNGNVSFIYRFYTSNI